MCGLVSKMLTGLKDKFNLLTYFMTAVHVDASYLIHCFLSVILSLGNHSNSVQLTSCIFCFISLVSISSNFVQVCCDFLVLSVLGFIMHITEELIMIILVISLGFF